MMQVPSVARGFIRASWLLWLNALIMVLALHSNAFAVTVSSQPVNTTVTQGQSVSFKLAASTNTGGAITYSWFKDRTRLSQSGNTLSFSSVTSSNAGSYSCMVADSASTYVCKSFTLTVNAATPVQITQQPASWSATEGASTSVSVQATGSGTLTYQWYKNGTAISGATSKTVSFPSVTTSNAGKYHVVVKNSISSVTSSTATLTVTAAFQRVSITQQPVGKSVTAGTPTSLAVTATGTGPLSYQWYKSGTAISGATSSTLSFSSPTTSNTGSYYVVVRNSGSTATSTTVSLNVTSATTVKISQQPIGASVTEGSYVRLSVTATGTGTLSYQWYKNGTALSGSTASSLTISSAKTSNSGTFYVVVKDANSSVTSSSAVLSVVAATSTTTTPVSITQQPSNQMVNAGTSVTFSVSASGSGTLTYQWYFNGTAISGATARTYGIASASAANQGSYHVIVRNSTSSATSSTASLSVLASSTTGSALLSWTRPTTRTDGSTLASSEIANYRIYWSNSSTGSMNVLSSPSASATSYRATELASGTHYFSISVMDINGLESSLSSRRSVTIP